MLPSTKRPQGHPEKPLQDILTKVLNSMLTTRIKITSVPQMNCNPGIKLLINTIVPKAQIIPEIYKLEFLFYYVLYYHLTRIGKKKEKVSKMKPCQTEPIWALFLQLFLVVAERNISREETIWGNTIFESQKWVTSVTKNNNNNKKKFGQTMKSTAIVKSGVRHLIYWYEPLV